MVKAIDSRAECLWLESRGSSFSKVLTHLPLLREAGVISVPWCWYCALADLAPPCAPYKDNISMRKGMKKPLAASGRVWQGGLELMKRYLTDLAVERKRSCPSQHQTSLASMTSQSLKSIKKPLATSVLGSNVPWSWWKHTSWKQVITPFAASCPLQAWHHNPKNTCNQCVWQQCALELMKARLFGIKCSSPSQLHAPCKDYLWIHWKLLEANVFGSCVLMKTHFVEASDHPLRSIISLARMTSQSLNSQLQPVCLAAVYALELMRRTSVGKKMASPSEHQMSLASVTSQSLKSIKKPLATSVLGSSVPWSWWKHTSWKHVIIPFAASCPLQAWHHNPKKHLQPVCLAAACFGADENTLRWIKWSYPSQRHVSLASMISQSKTSVLGSSVSWNNMAPAEFPFLDSLPGQACYSAKPHNHAT